MILNKQKASRISIYKRLLTYIWKYKFKFLLLIFFLLISIISYSLAPYFLGLTINSFTDFLDDKNNIDVLNTLLLNISFVFASYLIYSVFLYIANTLNIKSTQSAIYDIRNEIESKISKLPLKYYDSTTYGDILARLTNDVEVVSRAFQQCIFSIIKAIFIVIFMLVMMLSLNVWLTLTGLLIVPILIIACRKLSLRSRKFFDKQMKKTGELNGIIEEYYTGHNIVTLFDRQKNIQEKFNKTNQELYKNSLKGQTNSISLFFVTMATNNLGYALVAFVGVLLAIAGNFSVGMIQAFAQYLTQFTNPITEVMQQIGQIISAGSSASRIFDFIDEEEEIPETKNPKFPKKLKGNIKFDHVRFGYDENKILIKDLNINVKAGQKTAIVGPTGAGKTTLVNLIMRFYDVNKGAILVDDVDIRDMKRSDLRKIFGMVLQDTWLYSASIMDNIRYGKPDATDEEVIAAAKDAHADSFIERLPGSYNFILKENAENLAQGQRQLLTIARAILNNSPIMILDEATSSVDTRTELLIQKAMDKLTHNKTSFVIAHRLSTIKNADNILYMENGDILEVGNHKQLMKKNGLYANLYNSQFADEEE